MNYMEKTRRITPNDVRKDFPAWEAMARGLTPKQLGVLFLAYALTFQKHGVDETDVQASIQLVAEIIGEKPFTEIQTARGAE